MRNDLDRGQGHGLRAGRAGRGGALRHGALMAASRTRVAKSREIREAALRCARPSASLGHELTAEQRLAIEAAAPVSPSRLSPTAPLPGSRQLVAMLAVRPWSWSPSPSLPAPRAGTARW